MRRRHITFGLGAFAIITMTWATAETFEQPASQQSPQVDLVAQQVRPILEKHCFMCHGPQKQEGQLKISNLDFDIVKGADAEHWQEVLDRLNAGTMPPKGKSKLTDGERVQLTSWLTAQLKLATEARRSTGGRTVLRRLTRYEYNNTLRDLLGVDLDFAKDLPPEAAAELGFQNNSKVLVTSFLHLDHFQKIAKWALVEAFGAKEKPVSIELEVEPKAKVQPKQAAKKGNLKSSIAANTEGIVKFGKIPGEGPVMIRVTAWASRTGQGDYPNLRVAMGKFGKKSMPPGKLVGEVGVDAGAKAPRAYEFHVRAEDFPVNGNYRNFLAIRNSFDPGTSALATTDYPVLHVTKVELFAPYNKVWPPESRTRILIESKAKADEKAYAREVIEKFMQRAYRRPVSSQEATRMFDLFVKLRANSDSFDDAMTDTLSAVLISPGYRTNPSTSTTASGTIPVLRGRCTLDCHALQTFREDR